MTGSGDMADVVERLWRSNRPKVLGRLEQVVAAVEDLAAGREVDRAEAQRQAHALAGALGTYQQPGSALLKQAEQVLSATDDDRIRMARLAEQLRSLQAELVGRVP